MAKETELIQIGVKTPCFEPRGQMQKTREGWHCNRCEKQVWDLTLMPRSEAHQFISDPTINKCIRVIRHTSGRAVHLDDVGDYAFQFMLVTFVAFLISLALFIKPLSFGDIQAAHATPETKVDSTEHIRPDEPNFLWAFSLSRYAHIGTVPAQIKRSYLTPRTAIKQGCNDLDDYIILTMEYIEGAFGAAVMLLSFLAFIFLAGVWYGARTRKPFFLALTALAIGVSFFVMRSMIATFFDDSMGIG